MRERLWILVPAAGVPLLLVLFFVLWQSLQVQNRTIEDLGKRLDELEGLEVLGWVTGDLGTWGDFGQDLGDLGVICGGTSRTL